MPGRDPGRGSMLSSHSNSGRDHIMNIVLDQGGAVHETGAERALQVGSVTDIRPCVAPDLRRRAAPGRSTGTTRGGAAGARYRVRLLRYGVAPPSAEGDRAVGTPSALRANAVGTAAL